MKMGFGRFGLFDFGIGNYRGRFEKIGENII
jgi:hypothetical protein